MVALLARVVKETLGTSLFALRLLPALAAAVTVWMAMEMTRDLGGGRWARIMAGTATALAPVYLSLFSIFSMNAFDVVIWSALSWIVLKILMTGRERLWLLFGVIAGVGLQNKISVLFLGAGLVGGLVLSRRWGILRGRWFWTAGAIAFLIALPYLAWQVVHGWPIREFMRNAREYKMTVLPVSTFLREIVLHANPLALPLWVAGLCLLLFSHRARRAHALGWAALIVIAIMIATHAKPYYVAPLYALLFAAGAPALVDLMPGGVGRVFRNLYLGAVVAGGLLFAPLAKPLLPVETYVRYSHALGIRQVSDERNEVGRLPQFFADMYGWRELVETVAGVYRSLPPEDRARACIFAQNYGEAGAIDFFGEPLGLPRAISGHNSYFLWGPRGCDGDLVIVIGDDRESLEETFGSVERAATFTCKNCMPYENENPIWIARHAKRPVAELWPRVRNYI